jgi:transglutaminase-like putative cysteine protease
VRYQITHKTLYRYDNAVSVSHHVLRQTPRELPRQRVLSHTMTGDPVPTLVFSRNDYFGNHVIFLSVQSSHRQLSVTSQSRVEVLCPALIAPDSTPSWEAIRDQCRGNVVCGEAKEACEYAFPSPLAPSRPAFGAYASESFPPGRPILAAGMDLMARIHRDFVFDPAATTVATPVEEVFQNRRGVCQDFAHFQLACLRSLGLPARYISGYIETVPPPGQCKLAGADASHAWLQLWCGGAGWVDLDPTNNMLPADRHITVAWGRDYEDVSPLRGILLGSGCHQLEVAVDVIPLLL